MMFEKWPVIICCFAVISIVISSICYGNDLEDGISTYTDDSIAVDDRLGRMNPNMNFTVLNSLSQVKTGKKKNGYTTYGASGDKNINSVIVESGAMVDTVINIVPGVI